MACKYQGGYLVSIETEEEWQFINQEIKKTFFLEYYWVAHWFKKERDDLDLGKWSTTEYFEMATKGQKDKRSGRNIQEWKPFLRNFLVRNQRLYLWNAQR